MTTTETTAPTATTWHWIVVERDRSVDLVVGPYPTEAAADHAMTDSALVDHLLSPAGGGGVDCFLTAAALDFVPAATEGDQHWIDLTDPHHTGLDEDDTAGGARLALHALLLADQADNDTVRAHVEGSLDTRWPGATDRIAEHVTAQHMSPDDAVRWATDPADDAARIVIGA